MRRWIALGIAAVLLAGSGCVSASKVDNLYGDLPMIERREGLEAEKQPPGYKVDWGAGSAVHMSFSGTPSEDAEELTPEQKRLFTFGAVTSVRSGSGFGSLSGMTLIHKDDYAQGLDQGWNVVDHRSAISALEWLKTQGHRTALSDKYYDYDEIFAIASGRQATNEKELLALERYMSAHDLCVYYLKQDYGYTQEELDRVTTVAAWDYDRMVTLARWCYGLGYISEDEMWDYITWAADQGAAEYGSWREYFAAVLMGRAFWYPEYDFAYENQAVCDVLLKNKNSVYKQSQFQPSSFLRFS